MLRWVVHLLEGEPKFVISVGFLHRGMVAEFAADTVVDSVWVVFCRHM